MFGLFDIPAFILWGIGLLFQEAAKCMASQAFIKWKTGEQLQLPHHRQVVILNEKLSKVTSLHYQVYKEPFQLSLVNTVSGYSLYTGATCLTTGTIQNCDKYVDALLWYLHTRLAKGI